MPGVRLQKRDTILLGSLLTAIRVASFWQLVGRFFPTAHAARARLGRLVHAGFLSQFTTTAVCPNLDTPLFEWPSERDFNSSAISWQLERRWSKPPTTQKVFAATAKAAETFATKLPKVIATQVEHDLAVAQVYFRLSQADPQLRWMSEAEFHREFDGVVPDIAVVNDAGSPIRLIEIGGRYTADRLEALHLAFSGQIPWQLY